MRSSKPQNSAAPRPVYETDLALTPLPELLVTLYRFKAPGTLECRRGPDLNEIFFDRGQIVFASSGGRRAERPASREEVEDVLWSVFGWESGTVRFTPGRQEHRGEFVRLEMPIPVAIVEGVRHLPDSRSIVSRIGSPRTRFRRTDAEVEELTLDEDEVNLLAAVDGKRSLADLVNTPPLAPDANLRLLYAFLLLGLITR
jgi:hypothetical protein